jgi:hypothetical protein
MVAVINPASGQSFDAQIAAAKRANFQLDVNQTWPAEGSQPSTTIASSTINPNSMKSQRISSGAIAGIVIGVLLIVALAAALLFFTRRFKRPTNSAAAELDSRPMIRKITDDVEEQEVPVTMSYYQESSPVVQAGAVSPLSPRSEPPQRKKSKFERTRQQILQRTGFYQYPSSDSDKPEVPPPGHPAFGNPDQRYTVELDGDQSFNRNQI